MFLRLPNPSLVLLVGPSASGKSTWAMQNFREGQVLSSDHLRALIGRGPYDQSVSAPAFQLLDQLLQTRLDAGLITVVDSLGLNAEQRERHRVAARSRGVPLFAVGFDTPAAECKRRNDARGRPVPVGVLSHQLKRWKDVRDRELPAEDFDGVFIFETPPPVHIVPRPVWEAAPKAQVQRSDPESLTFGLQLARFPWDDAELGPAVAAVAQRAEDVGFDELWVMDHLRQIPQVGAAWEPLPEAYITLGYAAGVTNRIRLGTLVTAITYRNVALLAKMLASLDVLSGGRANCGIGAGWFEAEARAFGYDWPPAGRRLDLLEDALQVLPQLWGPGAKPFAGRVIEIPETLCYPRPLQDPIPILVGGGGEKRTLRLVAQYANAANLMGSPAQIRHKIGVLHQHCAEVGRDPSEIDVTALVPAVTAEDPVTLRHRVEQLAGPNGDPDGLAAELGAATVEDQIGRLRAYVDEGVRGVMLAVPGLSHPDDLEPYRPLIEAFR